MAPNPTRRSDVVEEGKPAPDFELRDDEGKLVQLSSLPGRAVVVYFYPKDDSPPTNQL